MIKPVCICKLNAITPGQSGPAPQTQIRRPTARPQQPNLAASKTLLPNRGSPYTYPSFANSKPTPPARKEFVQISQQNQQPPSSVTSFALHSSPRSHLLSSEPLFNSSSPQPQPSTGRPSTLSSQPRVNIKDIPTHNSELRPSRINDRFVPTLDTTMAIATNLPSSSIPSLPSSINSGNILEPRAVSNSDIEPVGHGDTRHGFLASMGETASIYAMSNTALEQMIGEVIREDGFVQLVSIRNVFNHWKYLKPVCSARKNLRNVDNQNCRWHLVLLRQNKIVVFKRSSSNTGSRKYIISVQMT